MCILEKCELRHFICDTEILFKTFFRNLFLFILIIIIFFFYCIIDTFFFLIVKLSQLKGIA